MSDDRYPDWLQAMINKTMSPGDIAKGDQKATAGKKAAVEILAQYMNFCLAMDQGNEQQAIISHLHVQLMFTTLPKETLQTATMFLVDILTQELASKHGDMEKMVRSALDGNLFNVARDPKTTKEQEILARLEKEL